MLHDRFGIDFFFDAAEDINSDLAYLKALAGLTWPKGIGFRHYCAVRKMSCESASLMRSIGTAQAFIGFESDDDNVLRLMNKASSSSLNRRCVCTLVEAGLPFVGSFVLGSEGETSDSLQKTLNFMEKLADTGLCDDIHVSVFKVLPGAPAFAASGEQFSSSWDWHGAQHRWIDQMCSVDANEIEAAILRVNALTMQLPRKYRRPSCSPS